MSNIGDFVIERGVLTGYKGLEREVVVPSGIKKIDFKAFSKNRRIQKVILPKGLKEIGGWAFYGCSKLEYVEIPDTVSVIDIDAFANCKKLVFAEVPNFNVKVFCKPFNGCVNLKMEYCGPAVFMTLSQSQKKEMTERYLKNPDKFPEKASEGPIAYIHRNKKTIGEDLAGETDIDVMVTFMNIIGEFSLDTIDNYLAIAEKRNKKCSEMIAMLLKYKSTHFSVGEINEKETDEQEKALGIREMKLADWRKIFKVSFKADGVHLTDYVAEDDVITVPETISGKPVVEVCIKAYNDKLRSIEFPSTLIGIRWSAFCCSNALETVVINRGPTFIETWAFRDCRNLKSVTIPDSVTSIEYGAFEWCKNLTLHAPAGSYAEQYAKENNIPFVAE